MSFLANAACLPAALYNGVVLAENAGLTAVVLGHALQLVQEMVADLQDQKHAEGGSSRPGHCAPMHSMLAYKTS